MLSGLHTACINTGMYPNSSVVPSRNRSHSHGRSRISRITSPLLFDVVASKLKMEDVEIAAGMWVRIFKDTIKTYDFHAYQF